VLGLREHGNELSGSVRAGNFLSNCELLIEDSVP
jgi:hypothetical protein